MPPKSTVLVPYVGNEICSGGWTTLERTLRHFHNFVSPFDLKKIVFNNIVYFSLNNKCKHIVLTSIKCVTNLLLQCVNPGHVQLYITTTVGTTPSLS